MRQILVYAVVNEIVDKLAGVDIAARTQTY
jgi:hypothetical protein